MFGSIWNFKTYQKKINIKYSIKDQQKRSKIKINIKEILIDEIKKAITLFDEDIDVDMINSVASIFPDFYFDLLSDSELSSHILLNEGIGKAGGYAIQGMGGKFIRKIRGSYSNVVGLCLNSLYKILINIGFKN